MCKRCRKGASAQHSGAGSQHPPSLPPQGLPRAQDQGLMRNPQRWLCSQREGMLLGIRRG